MCTLDKLIDPLNVDIWKQRWLQAWDSGLAGEQGLLWEIFLHEIWRDHIRIRYDSDEIDSIFKNSRGYYISNLGYSALNFKVVEDSG